MAVDGSSGKILWSISSSASSSSQEDQADSSPTIVQRSNFYTPLLIPIDVDSDGVEDVIVMHGGDPFRAPGQKSTITAKLLVLSARTGQSVRDLFTHSHRALISVSKQTKKVLGRSCLETKRGQLMKDLRTKSVTK